MRYLKIAIFSVLFSIIGLISGCYTIVYQSAPRVMADYNEPYDYYIIYEPHNRLTMYDYWYYKDKYWQPRINYNMRKPEFPRLRDDDRIPNMRNQPRQRIDDMRIFNRRDSQAPPQSNNNERPTKRR